MYNMSFIVNKFILYSGWQFLIFRFFLAICLIFTPISDTWLLPLQSLVLISALKYFTAIALMIGFFRRAISLLFFICYPYILPIVLLILVPATEPFQISSKQKSSFRLSKFNYYLGWLLLIGCIGLTIFSNYNLYWILSALIVYLIPPTWLTNKNNNSDQFIVFFDGVCNLCNQWVNICINIDVNHCVRYAPVQGSTAKQHIPQQMIDDLSSIVFLKNGNIFTKSTAVLHILRTFGGIWHIISWLTIIPTFIRDPLYTLIAKNRYSLFGKLETCRLPQTHEKHLFLS